jgi:hypothetical protein
MSAFSTPLDEHGQPVRYGKGAMRLRRTKKREEAEARQLKALLNAHPDGKCDCKQGERQHSVFIKEAAVKSDVVKKTRRSGKK